VGSAELAMGSLCELIELLQEWLALNDSPCRHNDYGCCLAHYFEQDCIVVRTKNAIERWAIATESSENLVDMQAIGVLSGILQELEK
jgi:hypothetical protein